MKRLAFVIGLLTATHLYGLPAKAADQAPKMLTPGRYVVNVMPPFNRDVAGNIVKEWGKFTNLDAVRSKTADSSIHFTVKDKTQIDADDLRKALQTVYAGAVMNTPVLEHSMSANPGL